MDRNAVFEKVALHLLTQNRKSCAYPGGGLCSYRGVGGTACALGAIISDDLYSGELEGLALLHLSDIQLTNLFYNHKYQPDIGDNSTEFLVDVLHKAVGISSVEDLSFLAALQKVHDKMDVSCWPDDLTRVALEFDIVVSHPTLLKRLPE